MGGGVVPLDHGPGQRGEGVVALDTATRKVERADARVQRAAVEWGDAFAALTRAMVERDYAAAHPLLKAAESEDVLA